MNNITTIGALTAVEIAVIAELNKYLTLYADEVIRMLNDFTQLIQTNMCI